MSGISEQNKEIISLKKHLKNLINTLDELRSDDQRLLTDLELDRLFSAKLMLL